MIRVRAGRGRSTRSATGGFEARAKRSVPALPRPTAGRGKPAVICSKIRASVHRIVGPPRRALVSRPAPIQPPLGGTTIRL
jgi:hypothetical protein